jgi:aspartyl-tRNA(Asn)/glutamyl-tRNA(Gln) amidotransferase subunit C
VCFGAERIYGRLAVMVRKTSRGNNLSEKAVIHVAKLANLRLSEAEVEKFQKQLSEVLEYMSQLDEIDGFEHGVEVEMGSETSRWREDKRTGEGLSQEEAVMGAKRNHNGCFVVPGVLDKANG